jgi:hypothetical protein
LLRTVFVDRCFEFNINLREAVVFFLCFPVISSEVVLVVWDRLTSSGKEHFKGWLVVVHG